MTNKLYIKVKGEAVDFKPGTIMELNEENPFLQMNDALQGDYSLPVELPLTDTNKRLFGHVQMLAAEDKLKAIENVQIGDDLEQITGILKKEQFSGNLNHKGVDTLNVYLLKGSSHFFKDVEKKTLKDCDYLGDRDLGPANNFRINAYVQDHIQKVMRTSTPDLFDYAIFPVWNSGKILEVDENDPTNHYLKTLNPIRIDGDGNPRVYDTYLTVLFPYLTFVIKRLFTSVGWTVDGFIFSDPTFQKIVLLNSQYITPRNINGRVTINLRDQVPPIAITTFLISLKNRYGWWYDFDYAAKKVIIRKIDEIFYSKRVDITKYCSTSYLLKLPAEKKVYGLSARNEGIDLTKFNFKGGQPIFANLPTANAANADVVYFVVGENRYYQCQIKDDSNIYEWVILCENDIGLMRDGKTDDIKTSCEVPTTRILNYHTANNFTPLGKIAVPDITLEEDNTNTDVFYTCFWHGHQDDQPINSRIYKYPFGSAANWSMRGFKLAPWAINYIFYGPYLGLINEGLYATFWKGFLDRISQKETLEISVRLPHHVALQLKWQDTVLIKNVEYIISKKSRVLPYNGEIKLTLARI